MDVSKDRHTVTVADDCRNGEVRFHGEIGSDDASVRRLVRTLERSAARLRCCYEAGPTGYGLERLIEELGHECAVIAPSLIPRRPGERVKTNRRDAVKLARLFRAGELTEIWTPDETQEAMRDLVRARETAGKNRTRKRQEIRSFLLRHGKVFPGQKTWGTKYFNWLYALSLGWPGQTVVLHEMIVAETQSRKRVTLLERAIEDALLDWPRAPVVERLQALRGVGLIAAVTFMVSATAPAIPLRMSPRLLHPSSPFFRHNTGEPREVLPKHRQRKRGTVSRRFWPQSGGIGVADFARMDKTTTALKSLPTDGRTNVTINGQTMNLGSRDLARGC